MPKPEDTDEAARLALFTLDHVSDMIYWVRPPEFTITFVNPAACEMLGYTREELQSMTVFDIDPQLNAEDLHRVWEEVRRQRHLKFETSHRRKDGVVIPVEIGSSYVSSFKGHEYSVAIVRDIRARKEAEEHMRNLNERLETQVAERTKGLQHEMAEREKIEQECREVSERFRLACKATRDSVYEWDLVKDCIWITKEADPEGVTISTNGYDWWINLIHPDDGDKAAASLRAALSSRQDFWSVEYRLRVAQEDYHYVLNRACVVRDLEGKAVKLMGAISDLSPLKEAEKALRNAERLSSLGMFAGGIAHEINNPLASILAGASAMEQHVGEPETVAQVLEDIKADVNRCSRIVKGLLQYSRGERGERWVFGFNHCVQGALKPLRAQADAHKVKLVSSLMDKDIPVSGSLIELQQVVSNLVANAIFASPRGGEVKITTAEDQQGVRLGVQDWGRGMSQEEQRLAFSPFYTTRSTEGGSGLGLALSHAIVVAHGGQIHLNSTAGQGTKVEVILARAGEKQASSSTQGRQSGN